MSVKKIALFAPVKSQYGVMHRFTEELAQAFTRQGVQCRILHAQRDKPGEFIDDLLNDRPDCTLSFNGLLPDEEGHFLADMLKLPHIACLIDSPNHFFELAKSKYTIITSIDRDFCEFFHGLHCPNVLFLPHAVDKDLTPSLSDKKIYEVMMLGSFTDYAAIRSQWKKKYSPSLCKVMDHAAEITLSEPKISYIQAFVLALDQALKDSQPIDPVTLNLPDIFDEIESYVRGKDRIELVKAIKDTTIHVVGTDNTEVNWKKFLGTDGSHIVTHKAVSYEESLKLMKQSKIILNSSPCYKNGAHERIFNGLACGAAVITSDSLFVREILTDKKDIIFYQPTHWDAVNGKIHELLSDEDKRKEMAEKGRTIVMQSQTWDHRAKTLIKELEPILKNLQTG